MNICYINPTNNIRRPIAELAAILAEKGHNISIMYPVSRNCPTKNWIANDITRNGKIHLIPIPSWYFAPLRYAVPNLFSLWKKVREAFKYNDKVHIWEYFYPLSVSALIYSYLHRQQEKTILTTDGFVGYSYRPRKPWWLVPAFRIYTQLIAYYLFRIPKIMTTYGKSMIPYARQAGVPMKRLRIIPTGIHLDKFQHISRKRVLALKKEFNIKHEKIILFVGMLTERKGVDKVIAVSQQLLKEGMNIKTLIVGDAHGKNPFKKMVGLEYREKILFTGGRKDIPEFMKLADVLLLPSEGEGLPGVVMEAMASGLPVVATKEGCTPDLIEDGKEGFLVENRKYYSPVKKTLFDMKISKNKLHNALTRIYQLDWKKISLEYQHLYFLESTKK